MQSKLFYGRWSVIDLVAISLPCPLCWKILVFDFGFGFDSGSFQTYMVRIILINVQFSL